MKSASRKKIEIYETHNLGDQKLEVEIYRTLFTTLIMKRKTYLKYIKIQGIPTMFPHIPSLAVLVDFLTRGVGVFLLCTTPGVARDLVGAGA